MFSPQCSQPNCVLQVKSARREVQVAQMAEKGVDAELDGAEFQAPDLTAPDPDQPPGTSSPHCPLCIPSP